MIETFPVQPENTFGHLPDVIREMEALGLVVSDNPSLLTIGERDPNASVIAASKGEFTNYNLLIEKDIHHYNIPFKKDEQNPGPYTTKFNIFVIEGFLRNCGYLTSQFPDWDVLWCDISQVESINMDWSKFDFIMWYHGPEHLAKFDSIRIVNYLQKRSKFIVLAMPNGFYPQGTIGDNELENHMHHFKASDWEDLDCDALVIEYGEHNKCPTFSTGAQLKVLIPGEIK